MATEGTILGPRRYYKYTSDDGNDYKILCDVDNAVAMQGTTDDALVDLPRRYKPRGVYVETEEGNRKFLIAWERSAIAYATNKTTTVTLKGEVWNTTGRTGERATFGVNKELTPPDPNP